MPKWETRQCGVTRGRCASCGEEADLRLTESSFKRSWRDVFDSSFDARVDRRVSCSACRRTYPVRSGDATPDAATSRSGPTAGQGSLPPAAQGPGEAPVQAPQAAGVSRRRADDAPGDRATADRGAALRRGGQPAPG